jgi:hypothetical protein
LGANGIAIWSYVAEDCDPVSLIDGLRDFVKGDLH